MVALSSLVTNFAQLALGLTDALLDSLVVIEGHIPAHLGFALRSGLPSLLRRIDVVHDLDVSEALDGLRRVHADFAATVVLNGHLVAIDHLHLDENERDGATLVLE